MSHRPSVIASSFRPQHTTSFFLPPLLSHTHIITSEEILRSTVVAPLVQKGIPYTSSGVVGGFTGDELEDDYKQIKNLIAQDCTFLLEISSTENSCLHVFSFLANSFITEVLWAIQQGKPGAFSHGRPTDFLKNYKSSLGFLADLEDNS
ncbi:unnamed protein product [Lactuca virosa]|uniref:Uncharacterized protein n=1 Tax=Lactuca virosa TaxID=75947 RepID=A0AAU9M2G1_9ASTR|nr:unnamed protein product [Lactuca virosa]